MEPLANWERTAIHDFFEIPLNRRFSLKNITDEHRIKIRDALNKYEKIVRSRNILKLEEDDRDLEIVDYPVYGMLMRWQYMRPEEMTTVLHELIKNGAKAYIKRKSEIMVPLKSAPAAGGAYTRKTRRMKRRSQRKSRKGSK